MKKFIIRALLTIATAAVCGGAAFASGTDMPTPPNAFDALVVKVFDMGVTPLEYDFMFSDGEETMCFYAYDVATSGGGTVRVERDYMLTYCKTTCLSGEPVFITGSYSETNTGSAEGYMTGHVEGRLLTFDDSAPDLSFVGRTFIALTHFPDTADGVQAPEQLAYTVVFLEPVGWFPAPEKTSSFLSSPTQTPSASPAPSPAQTSSAAPRAATPAPNSGFGLFASPTSGDDHHTDDPYAPFEEDHHHSSGGGSSHSRSARGASSDLPEAADSAQVAVGAILVAVAAALSNIPATTLGSGMSSFAYVAGGDPSGGAASAQSGAQESAPSASEGAEGAARALEGAEKAIDEGVQSATLQTAASQTSSAPQSMSGMAQSSGSGVSGSGNFLSAIGDFIKHAADAVWDFIKMLLANLRDMLTDEGRSYAGGKLSDLFEDEE